MKKVRHGDSYELIVIRYHSIFYIDAKHYTKKHPSGVTLLYEELNRHIGFYDVQYLEDTLGCESFKFKREDGYEFDVIDKRLNRILKYEAYLGSPKSWKCVPSVLEQLDREYKMLIYNLISFRDDKK